MPRISTSDFKTGITLDLPDGLFELSEFQHVNPGKGGAFVRTKLRDLRHGTVVERTFRAGERMEQAMVDHRSVQLLYHVAGSYVFMDNNSFEQVEVSEHVLGDSKDYLVPELTATLSFYGPEIIGVELPSSVALEVVETDPGLQGDRVSRATKLAIVETGKSIRVPLFVRIGDRVIVNTATGEYVSRT